MFIEVNNKLININSIINVVIDCNELYQSYRLIFKCYNNFTEELYFENKDKLDDYYKSLKKKLNI